MVVVGYFVVILTVLSISAISTSATVEGGGVYCILMPIHVTIHKYYDCNLVSWQSTEIDR